MNRKRVRERSAWLCGLSLLLLAAPAQAQEAPDDNASMSVEFRANTEISATEILASWANKFDALVIQDPQIQNVKIKFLTNTDKKMTWGTIKQILDFYDIVVVESQPNKNGPWLIRAHHRRNLAQKEGPPWRYVDETNVPNHEEMVTAVFQVKNGAGNSIFATVRGLLTRDTNRVGNILYVQGPEVLIIVDLASKVRYYQRVIKALDVAGPRKEMKIFPISYAPVQDLANILSTVLTQLAGSGVGGTGGRPVVVGNNRNSGQAQPQVIADPRTNQLIVAAFPIDFPLVERVVSALDKRVAPPSGRFHVYKCKDADAEDLASKVSELFTGQATSTSRNQRATGRRPGQTSRPRPVRATGGSGAVSLGGGEGVGEVETRIVADERTNSLLIQAEEQAYREILAVLAQLDKKRRRVLIEAEVWEVSTPTDQLTIGFELASVDNAHEGSTRGAAATSFGLSQITPVTDANGNTIRLGRTPNIGTGLVAAITRDTFDKLPIIMAAVHNFERSNLVTRPFAMTNDNTPATFTISNRQPFLTTTVNNVASQQNVQFVDANSTLTIEPQVNSNRNLTLKLTLEISSFSGSGSATLPPGTNSRRYEGEVTVPNGKYVVFGGLESWTERYVEDKIPFLGDIPILGHLFKNWTRSKTKTKVYIFVRPTIFSDDDFSGEAQLATHFRERIQVESERDEWLPPVVPDRFMQGPGYTLQDEAFDTFGTGSANPFRRAARSDESE